MAGVECDQPLAFAHDGAGWQHGVGDVEASAKYRFYNDEQSGLQIAAFPGVSIPTASRGLGAGKVTALLPVWAQQDLGRWSIFGGGGYAINPGAGNRDYWTGGAAVTLQASKAPPVGVEVDRQGPDTIDGRASTSLGLGAILKLRQPFRLLASGGPTFVAGDISSVRPTGRASTPSSARCSPRNGARTGFVTVTGSRWCAGWATGSRR